VHRLARRRGIYVFRRTAAPVTVVVGSHPAGTAGSLGPTDGWQHIAARDAAADIAMKRPWQISIGDYAPLIGEEAAERIEQKAYRLRGLSIVHVSSTFYGGGVAEMLSSMASPRCSPP